METSLIFRQLNLSDPKDITDAVNVIRRNLDKSFTREFFIWKHCNNPFGKSKGVFLQDESQIVGIRMLMNWEFFNSGENLKLKAVRPVDTAIDVNYRGKGYFKELNAFLMKFTPSHYDFIFNTPNNNSLPGNLKMGWKQLENISNFQIGIVNPFFKSLEFSDINSSQMKLMPDSFNPLLSTLLTEDFLAWRYKGEDYRIASFALPGHYLIYKLSKIGGLPVLIVYENIGKPEFIEQMLNSLGKKNKVWLIYFYYKNLRSKVFLKIINRKKPVVVVKDDKKNNLLLTLNLSLGDLEAKI
ncbi:hypothetical protein SAMN06296241_1872 [Salinimicrobium sediminis]|uniref:Uncharacterized protein n=1 Tax=Salinimicrobium sediminis TaxID=1343891 RepID=A0A285X6A7_9FLAO|nr:hypothetical protein [Salinimicrobium sediminis]SOC80324.1 hypothetical protein SAMN06296241_1872 [Salinimicrobium sediminis]